MDFLFIDCAHDCETTAAAFRAWETAVASGGVVAFHDDWIEQLYVLPEMQGQGLGTALLDVAKHTSDRLQLWTFQRNTQARRFYEARGFALVEQTDGSSNEEKEPDARYLWTRA